MSTDAGRERIDKGTRPRGTPSQLTSAAQPEQVGGEACSISQESVEQSTPERRNLSHRSEVKSREAERGRATSGAWVGRLRYYGLALLLVTVGVILRMMLTRWVGPGMPTYITFSPFVMLAALIGGWGPGLLATLATAVVVSYWLLPPPGSFKIESPADAAGLAFFCFMGIFVSIVAELYRRTRDHLDELVVVRTTALTQANEQLHQEVAERRRAEDEKKKLVHDLRERIKELTAMYRTMEIVQQPKPVHELLQEVVSLLPRAWQYPEITAARLSFDGQEYRTPGYAGSEWAQSARFSTRDAKDGSIEVVYLEKRPAEAEGPFLAEERSLIDSLARTLEGFLNRTISEEALRESEERFRTAFEEGSVAMALTALDSTLLKVNSRFCRMLGFSESELVGRSYLEITHPDDRAANLVGTRQLACGEISSFHMEKRYVRKDGAVLWADMNTAAVQDAEGRPLYCVTHVQDITERKQAEEALRESRRRLERAQEIAHLGSWELDLASHRLTWSDEVYRIFGLQPREFAATYEAFLDRVHPEDRAAVDAAYSGSLREGRDTYEIEHRIVRKDTGEIRLVHEKCDHVRDASGRIIRSIGMVHDITERKQAEQELRELNATLETRVARRTAQLQYRARQLQKLTLELTEAEERERKRLAGILHDDLQQVLAAAKFQVGLLSSRVRNDAESHEIAEQTKGLLGDAIATSRSLSHELSAPGLSRSNLVEAFEWLAEQMQQKHRFTVHLEMGEQIEVASEPLRVLLYKAAQELLFNVIKHAGVHEAELRLRHRRGRFRLLVSDTGRGFDPTEPGYNLGFGLLGIRERVEYLGGRMKIRSAPGKGSIFVVAVPDAEDAP